ncbi:unnamed protein product [Nippostrongylus brasiliensis]|uniref:Uncharacterized protein n=1 Tax=Nippostrongylus brasiliensis TaxID=27835 RepID=A0A0N4XMH7_NIPBR|nr:unnamed protein product [Nippostrongylus brasiliensis]
MQRQHRRSTQGVTKEHLEEASRIAMAENARRRGSTNTQNAATTPTVTSGSTPKETLSGAQRVWFDWLPKNAISHQCIRTEVQQATREARKMDRSEAERTVHNGVRKRRFFCLFYSFLCYDDFDEAAQCCFK